MPKTEGTQKMIGTDTKRAEKILGMPLGGEKHCAPSPVLPARLSQLRAVEFQL